MQNSTPATPAMLLTPRQAAKALAISERKLWAMGAAGEIPRIQLGRCVRYSVDDLHKWIESQKKGGDKDGTR